MIGDRGQMVDDRRQMMGGGYQMPVGYLRLATVVVRGVNRSPRLPYRGDHTTAHMAPAASRAPPDLARPEAATASSPTTTLVGRGRLAKALPFGNNE